MLEKYHYMGMAKVIGEMDVKFGPNHKISCIPSDPDAGDTWRIIAAAMMMRVSHSTLLRVLTNRLPTDARELKDAVSSSAEAMDPVVYVNHIADADGNGLTFEEFEKVLTAMENARDPNYDAADKLDEQRRITVPDTAGFRQRSLQRKQLKTDQHAVQAFCAYHRDNTIPRARDTGCERIMVPAEVGWTPSFERLALDYQQLKDNSPWLYRLFYAAVIQHIPRRFTMRTCALFEIVMSDEPAIGESIASHLCASYTAYGGFNVDQAGYKITDVMELNTDERWITIADNAVELGYFKHLEANSEACERYHEEFMKEHEAKQAADRALRAEAERLERVVEQDARDAEAALNKWEEKIIELERLIREAPPSLTQQTQRKMAEQVEVFTKLFEAAGRIGTLFKET